MRRERALVVKASALSASGGGEGDFLSASVWGRQGLTLRPFMSVTLPVGFATLWPHKSATAGE